MGPKRSQRLRKRSDDSDSGEATPPRRMATRSMTLSRSDPPAAHPTSSRKVLSRQVPSVTEAGNTARMSPRQQLNRPTCSVEASAPRRSFRLSREVCVSSVREAVMISSATSSGARRKRQPTTQESGEILTARRVSARLTPTGLTVRRIKVEEFCVVTKRLRRPTTWNERSANRQREASPPRRMPTRVARRLSSKHCASADRQSNVGEASTSSARLATSGKLTKAIKPPSTISTKSLTNTEEPRPSTSWNIDGASTSKKMAPRAIPTAEPSTPVTRSFRASAASLLRRVSNFFSRGGEAAATSDTCEDSECSAKSSSGRNDKGTRRKATTSDQASDKSTSTSDSSRIRGIPTVVVTKAQVHRTNSGNLPTQRSPSNVQPTNTRRQDQAAKSSSSSTNSLEIVEQCGGYQLRRLREAASGGSANCDNYIKYLKERNKKKPKRKDDETDKKDK